MPPADPRVAALATAGAIRLALFLPQYAEDAAGIRGIGTGFIAIEIVGALAERARHCGARYQISVAQGRGCRFARRRLRRGISRHRTIARRRGGFFVGAFRVRLFAAGAGRLDDRELRRRRSGRTAHRPRRRPRLGAGVAPYHQASRADRRRAARERLRSAEGSESRRAARFRATSSSNLPGDCPVLACWRKATASIAWRWPCKRAVQDGAHFSANSSQEAKASGLLRRIIARGALRGFEVAPPETRS